MPSRGSRRLDARTSVGTFTLDIMPLVLDYLRDMEERTYMSYNQTDPLGYHELFDDDRRMNTRGYTHTRPFVTKPKLYQIERKAWMATFGLDRVNAKLFLQDMVWVDGNGKVYSLPEIPDRHLERLICWMEAGRDYLKQHRDIKVLRSPMHVALCAERDRRWKLEQEQEKKEKEQPAEETITLTEDAFTQYARDSSLVKYIIQAFEDMGYTVERKEDA